MQIRFMGEHTVDMPLWDEGGLMFGGPHEALEQLGPLGVSAELVQDMQTWALEWQSHAGEWDHDARAAQLVRRLRGELGHGVQIVYHP